MQIELTARQRATLIDDLISESSTPELEALTMKVVREYARFQGADIRKVKALVDKLAGPEEGQRRTESSNEF